MLSNRCISIREAIGVVLVSGLVWGQSDPSFEAASIKVRANPQGAVHFALLPNRLEVSNMSLEFLIEQAYDLPSFELSGPEAVLARHYDIEATSGAAVSGATMRAMLRALLIQRFHLATHWTEKTESIYRLIVLPGGHKMKSTDHGYAMANSPMRTDHGLQLTGPMTMHQLSERLTRATGRPVLDATGLDGYFIINLNFAPDEPDTLSGNGLEAPRLTTAVEDQIGLKLVASKDSVNILVIDHAETVPTEN